MGEELERAQKSLEAADLLFRHGSHYYNDAVSRLYYFILHGVRALLLSKGLEPKSHEAALRLLSLHFIKTGIFEPKDSHAFARLMKYREEADYNASYVFTEQDYIKFKEDAEQLYKKITSYLKVEGYL
jgi:hypothetical protein